MPRSSRALLGIALAGCAGPTAETWTHPLDGGDHWVHAPADLPEGAPALFHLHHSGDAERLATDPDVQGDRREGGGGRRIRRHRRDGPRGLRRAGHGRG